MTTQIATGHQVKIYPPEWNGNYPGFMSRDREIWIRFINHFGHKFTGFAYNVRCGTPGPVPEYYPRNMRHMWEMITTKRIDAIGFSPVGTWIFEVKSDIIPGGIGQLITYYSLARECMKLPEPITLALVTDRMDTDIARVATQWGIQYIQV